MIYRSNGNERVDLCGLCDCRENGRLSPICYNAVLVLLERYGYAMLVWREILTDCCCCGLRLNLMNVLIGAIDRLHNRSDCLRVHYCSCERDSDDGTPHHRQGTISRAEARGTTMTLVKIAVDCRGSGSDPTANGGILMVRTSSRTAGPSP